MKSHKKLAKAIPLNVNDLLIKDFINFEHIRTSGKDELDIELKICSYFTMVSVIELEELSFNELDNYLWRAKELISSKPSVKKHSLIKVNGIRYRAAKSEKDFKTNQYTAYSQYNENPLDNLHKKLSVIYSETKLFKEYQFNESNIRDRALNFYNYGRVGQVYGTLFFYSNLFEGLNLISQAYSVIANEEIKNHMEQVYQGLQDLGINTDGTMSSTLLQAQTLLKKMS